MGDHGVLWGLSAQSGHQGVLRGLSIQISCQGVHPVALGPIYPNRPPVGAPGLITQISHQGHQGSICPILPPGGAFRFKRRSALRSRSRLLGRQQMAPLVTQKLQCRAPRIRFKRGSAAQIAFIRQTTDGATGRVNYPKYFQSGSCGALWCRCAPCWQSLELRRTTG